LDRLPHCDCVEPAATPLAPGNNPELAAALAELLADRVLELGRKRSAADASCVGLGDAEYVADRARSDTRPGRGLSCHRVRRRDERIGAVVDIQPLTPTPFEQATPA